MFGVARDANKNKHIYFIKQLAERKLVFVGGPKRGRSEHMFTYYSGCDIQNPLLPSSELHALLADHNTIMYAWDASHGTFPAANIFTVALIGHTQSEQRERPV